VNTPVPSGGPDARAFAFTGGARSSRDPRRQFESKRGQSLIEAVFVILVLALIFFAAMEMSRIFAGVEIMDHAAATGVRAKAVGFNDFMVEKVVRVATIPNAGIMVTPVVAPPVTTPADAAYYRDTPVYQQWQSALQSNPSSPQLAVERARIPLYLGGERYGELDTILDYTNWDTVRPANEINNGNSAGVVTYQSYPVRMPMAEFFYGHDTFPMRGEAWHANHSGLYLE